MLPIPRRSSPLLAGLAILLAATACGDASGGGSEARLEAAVDTVEGVERRTYPAERAARLPWGFDTTAVLGGFGVDDPDYQFGSVADVGFAADSEGSLYLLDPEGIRVLGYAPDGSFLGTWGREGGGPGELGGGFGGGPRAMDMGPGDTLWISDRANQRFTLFPVTEPEGQVVSVPMPQAQQRLAGKISVDTAGVLGVMSAFSFGPGEETDGLPSRPLARIGRDGEPGDTLWTFPAPVTDQVTITSGGNQLMMMMGQQFSPGSHWVRFSDGVVALADGPEYEIRFLAPDGAGAVEKILRREPAPRPTTEADRQAHLDSMLAPPEEETRFNTAEIRRQRAEATTFAEVIPRIVEMRVDTRDRLWVGVSEETPGRIDRIDVYGRDGALLGELRETPMPSFFYGDGRAAILDTDELDVQQLHMLRLIDEAEELESVANAGG
ncbi:MAG: hypothetical protein ACOC9N_03830 [Gemmatimonadota bacterium]